MRIYNKFFRRKKEIGDYKEKEQEASEVNQEDSVKTKPLSYIVGEQEAKRGVYKPNIGREKIGYFDPWRVIIRITSKGWETSWPPDESDKVALEIGFRLCDLARALGITRPVFGFGASPKDAEMFLINLMKAGSGEISKFISESTELPFFKKYSVGEKVVVIDEINKEVMLNALINFFLTEISIEKASNMEELTRLGEERVIELRKK